MSRPNNQHQQWAQNPNPGAPRYPADNQRPPAVAPGAHSFRHSEPEAPPGSGPHSLRADLDPGLHERGWEYVYEDTVDNRTANWIAQYSLSPDETFLVREWFLSVDTDQSGEIDADEIKSALEAGGEQFTKGQVDAFVQLFDNDNSGTIDFDEFSGLFRFIRSAREGFEANDGGTGRLGLRTTALALQRAGFEVHSPVVVTRVFRHFGQDSRDIDFATFLDICTYLARMKTMFLAFGGSPNERAKINFDQLVDCLTIFSFEQPPTPSIVERSRSARSPVRRSPSPRNPAPRPDQMHRQERQNSLGPPQVYHHQQQTQPPPQHYQPYQPQNQRPPPQHPNANYQQYQQPRYGW